MQTTAPPLLRACATLLAACVALAPARADVLTLRPVADTALLETVPNNNLGGQSFFTAGTTQNNTRTRGLLRFDLALLPANATILSASLQTEVTRQPVDGYAIAAFGLHRLLQPWGEGTQVAANPLSPGQGAPATSGEATWLQRFAGTAQTWSAPGGAAGVDFAAQASSLQTIFGVGNSPYTFASTPELVADVQAWLDAPAGNFGWMLLCESENVNFTARRFGSREDLVNAPVLQLQFAPVPEPATLALLGLGLLAFRRASSAEAAGPLLH